eukprot:10240840-Lingulodinium_polyedra.AAC.1
MLAAAEDSVPLARIVRGMPSGKHWQSVAFAAALKVVAEPPPAGERSSSLLLHGVCAHASVAVA